MGRYQVTFMNKKNRSIVASVIIESDVKSDSLLRGILTLKAIEELKQQGKAIPKKKKKHARHGKRFNKKTSITRNLFH